MLVLSRHVNERIRIGDDVVLTVVRINGGLVRLGIDAPRDVAVVREELLNTPARGGSARLTEPSPPSADSDPRPPAAGRLRPGNQRCLGQNAWSLPLCDIDVTDHTADVSSMVQRSDLRGKPPDEPGQGGPKPAEPDRRPDGCDRRIMSAGDQASKRSYKEEPSRKPNSEDSP